MYGYLTGCDYGVFKGCGYVMVFKGCGYVMGI